MLNHAEATMTPFNHNYSKTLWYLAILLFVFSFTSQVHAKTIIRFATVAPDGSSWMKEMRSLNDDVKAQSGGEVEFKFYPNMVMGDEKDVIRKMRLGQIQAAGFTGFGLGEIVPEIRILELPYLFENDEEIDVVADTVFSYFHSEFARKGFVFLGWADVGWIYFLSAQPIAEPENIVKSKMWSWLGDPLSEEFFQSMGKTPVQLSVTDVLLSLQTGLLDAVYCSPLAALALQWFTQVSYVSDIPFTHSTGAVLLDKKTYDKLSPENQKILTEQSKRHLRQLVLQAREDNRTSYQLILSEGVVQSHTSPEQHQKMKKIAEKVQVTLSGKLFSEEVLKRVKNIIEKHRNQK